MCVIINIIIFSLALTSLINKGGQLDTNINMGTTGLLALVERVFPLWRLDVEGNLPADLRNRGVDDPDVLPGYYFRDDAILLHGAIKEYVEFVVNKRYCESHVNNQMNKNNRNNSNPPRRLKN